MPEFDALSVQSIEQYQRLLKRNQKDLKYFRSMYIYQYNALPSVILSLVYSYLRCVEAIETVRGCSRYYNSTFRFAAAQHWKQWGYTLRLPFKFAFKISQLHQVFAPLQFLTLDLSSVPDCFFEISLSCPFVRSLTLDNYHSSRHPWVLSKLKYFAQLQEISIEVIEGYDRTFFESLFLFDYNRYKSIEIILETTVTEFGWSDEQGKLLNNAIPVLTRSLTELLLRDLINTRTTLVFFCQITSLQRLSLMIHMQKVYVDHETIKPYELTELRALVNLNQLELECAGTAQSFCPVIDFSFLDSLIQLKSLTLEHRISFEGLCLLLKTLPSSAVEKLQFSSVECILLQYTREFHQTASNASKLTWLSVDEILFDDDNVSMYGIEESSTFCAF